MKSVNMSTEEKVRRWEQILELLDYGWTYDQIAEFYGIKVGLVAFIVSRGPNVAGRPRVEVELGHDVVQRAIRMYESGCSGRDVAKHLGVSYPTALALLRRNGADIRPKGRQKKNMERDREIASRYDAGETQASLAKEFGLTAGRISSIIKAIR